MGNLINIESAESISNSKNTMNIEKAERIRQENIHEIRDSFDQSEREAFECLLEIIENQTYEVDHSERNTLNQETLRELIFSCKKLKTRADVFLSREFHFYCTLNSLSLAQKILREFTKEADDLAKKVKNETIASSVVHTAFRYRRVIEKKYIP